MFSFNESIEPANWNKHKQRVKTNGITTSDGKHYLNDLLDSLEKVCISTYYQESKNGIPTPTILKEALKSFLSRNRDKEKNKPQVPTLFELANKFIAGEIKFRGRDKAFSTLKGYKTCKHSLQAFEKKNGYKISYESINLEFFYQYISYLKSCGLAHNSISKRIRTIRVWMNESLELGYTTNTQWKTRKFSVPEKEVESVYLSDGEIVRLYNFVAPSKKLESVKDLFVLACCTGLRYSDVSNIKPENIVEVDGDVYLHVITKKTGNKVIIPCNPIVLELFKKYECNSNKLPKSISGQKFNEYIKEVCKLAGFTETGRLLDAPQKPLWECITSHTGRRSAITNWYNGQFPMLLLMQISGHKTTASFMRYVKTSKLQSAQKLSAHIKDRWSKLLLKAV